MEAERDRTSILFFDACRNNPLARNLAASLGTRSVSEGAGLAQQETGAGTLISYSTAPGNVALDGDGRNSPYTGALVKQILGSGDHLAEMLYEVRNSVMKASNGSQVPWENSALTRRFYFKEITPAPPVVAALPPVSPQVDAPGTPADQPVTEFPFPPVERPATVPGLLNNGDMALSGFSGTKLVGELKHGMHPSYKTIIDPDGAALRVFDMSKLVWEDTAVLTPPIKLEIKASEIGQVFGLTFDNGTVDQRPNLFATATSQFGLNIIGDDADGDGAPDRLKTGAANAVFMEGQFGTKFGGGPGSVWKIDGITGKPALFANVTLNGAHNSGPGLGDVAFDSTSGNLYVSDLDTGLIHRFDLAGTELGRFDHGIVGRAAEQVLPCRMTASACKFPVRSLTWKTPPHGVLRPRRGVSALLPSSTGASSMRSTMVRRYGRWGSTRSEHSLPIPVSNSGLTVRPQSEVGTRRHHHRQRVGYTSRIFSSTQMDA